MKIFGCAAFLIVMLLSSACPESRTQTTANHDAPANPPSLVIAPPTQSSATDRGTRSRFVSAEQFHCYSIHSETLCDLNTTRSKWFNGSTPRSPLIASYQDTANDVIISVAFGPAFASNLPIKLNKQIKNDQPDSLDIFWAVQKYHSGFEPSWKGQLPGDRVLRVPKLEPIQQLKAHFWVEPNVVARPQLKKEEVSFHRSLHMRLFDTLDTIDRQLNKKTMVDVDVNIHDENRISPPGVGEVNLEVLKQVRHTAFWSYVFDHSAPKGHRRAVATLHWLVDYYERDGLAQILRSHASALTLTELLEALKQPYNYTASKDLRVFKLADGELDFDDTKEESREVLNFERLVPSLAHLMKE